VALIGRRRLTPSLAGSSILLGAPISSIGLVPYTGAAALLFGVGGAGYSVIAVAGRTLLQRTAPERALARIFGVLESLSDLALAIGSVGSALLVESLGIAGALLVTGLFVPVVLAIAWFELRAIDREAPEPDSAALALLTALPMFAPLSAPTMERILASLVPVEVPAGETLIREGEPGDRFYVLAEGRVSVSVDGREIAQRQAPDHIGEIALLRDVPRTATVTALTPLRLLALERAPFLEAVTGHAGSQRRAASVMDERLAIGAKPG
jgi:MFS family permease